MVAYEIWDDGNRLGRFGDRTKALEAVRILLENDRHAEATLILLEDTSTGRRRRVASGSALSALANARIPA